MCIGVFNAVTNTQHIFISNGILHHRRTYTHTMHFMALIQVHLGELVPDVHPLRT